nr:PsbP-related protein [uncultured Methanobacterium sp.]
MSEDGPPRLRKPGNNTKKKDSTSKLGKASADIKEKIGSLKLKNGENSFSSKVNSLKSQKNSDDKQGNDGPTRLRVPRTESEEKLNSNNLKKTIPKILRKRSILSIIGIIILIILVVTTAMWFMGDHKAITNQSSNNTTQTLKNHFDNGNISFDYPEGWNITNVTNQSSMVVTVTHDENNSFSVFKEDLGTQNFTYRVSEWRSNILKNGMIYYEGDLTIDNITAYELEANYKPKDKVFTTRGIAFQKNNTAYFVIFVFDQALLDYKNEMDKVINSFHVNG